MVMDLVDSVGRTTELVVMMGLFSEPGGWLYPGVDRARSRSTRPSTFFVATLGSVEAAREVRASLCCRGSVAAAAERALAFVVRESVAAAESARRPFVVGVTAMSTGRIVGKPKILAITRS